MITLPNKEVMRKNKMRSTDYTLKIRPVDGKNPRSGTGMIDPGLFTGSNQLHIKRDPFSTLWHFQYEKGVLPPSLRASFTRYEKALDHVTRYFKNRNLQIVEIID